MSHEETPTPELAKEKRDFYRILRPIAKTALDLKFHRGVLGTENIPEGPALFAPNHLSFYDSPLVGVSYTEATGRPMRFGAKIEYFNGGGTDDKGTLGRTMRWLMDYSHMIPVDRDGTGNRDSYNETLRLVGLHLGRGEAVGLHPEGTRSTDGMLHKYKSGIGRMALQFFVPIVPVGVTYTDYDNKRKTHVEIEFGRPVTPEEFSRPPYSLLPNRQKSEIITQTIENEVAAITGMKQSGEFATLRKLRGKPGHSK